MFARMCEVSMRQAEFRMRRRSTGNTIRRSFYRCASSMYLSLRPTGRQKIYLENVTSKIRKINELINDAHDGTSSHHPWTLERRLMGHAVVHYFAVKEGGSTIWHEQTTRRQLEIRWGCLNQQTYQWCYSRNCHFWTFPDILVIFLRWVARTYQS